MTLNAKIWGFMDFWRWREHPNFQLNYRTGTAISFRASREH